MIRKMIIALFCVLPSYPIIANDVLIENVAVSPGKQGWTFHTTLRHQDSGWDHYADAWRVVGEDGEVFGTRTLFHPHVEEQPFTRSLSNVQIPASAKVVFIEAHDKVHGWSKRKARVEFVGSNQFEVVLPN